MRKRNGDGVTQRILRADALRQPGAAEQPPNGEAADKKDQLGTEEPKLPAGQNAQRSISATVAGRSPRPGVLPG